MLFFRFISKNPIGHIKKKWIRFIYLKYSNSFFLKRIQRKTGREKSGDPLTSIQQILGFFLLLVGGIGFNAFATKKAKPEKPALLLPNKKTVPTSLSFSITMDSDSENFSESRRRGGNISVEVWNTIYNATEHPILSGNK